MKTNKRITHIIPYNVFGFKFIRLLEHNNVLGKHFFVFYSFTGTPTYSVDDYPKSRHKISRIGKNLIVNWFTLFLAMIKSDIVIQHGLFDPRHIVSYNFVPFVKKKLFWFVWGGDLYYGFDFYDGVIFRILSSLRSCLLKRVSNLISALDSDLDFFTSNYHSLMTSRFLPYSYDLDLVSPIKHLDSDRLIRIMVGNNATKANHHFKILDKLHSTRELNEVSYKILLPLSYGDIEYADSVAKYAFNLFGDKIETLRDFMNIRDYNKILSNVDVAILDHDMPEGLGVILQLLAYGKKIYVKSTNPLFIEFHSKKITVFDSLGTFKGVFYPLNDEVMQHNYIQTSRFYSNNSMLEKWNDFFNSV